MDKPVCNILSRELLRRSAQVPFLEEVALFASVDRRKETEHSDVKLALVDEQRSGDVPLHNVRPPLVAVHVLDQLLGSVAQLDTFSSIRVLSRLNDPARV